MKFYLDERGKAADDEDAKDDLLRRAQNECESKSRKRLSPREGSKAATGLLSSPSRLDK
jgi:hypothetical protein